MNRGKYEIYRDILACCYKGEIKSRLMTKCRISWSQVKQILPFLLDQGFLESRPKKHPDGNGHMRQTTVYQTTQKGVVLLMALENVEFILKTEYARNLWQSRYVATATV